MKWTLILTVLGLWDTGQAVTSVSGFSTQEECLAAGDAWLKQIRSRADDDRSNVKVYALCVKQSVPLATAKGEGNG